MAHLQLRGRHRVGRIRRAFFQSRVEAEPRRLQMRGGVAGTCAVAAACTLRGLPAAWLVPSGRQPNAFAGAPRLRRCVLRPAPRVRLYDATFSRTVWRLYGGAKGMAKGLVMWYCLGTAYCQPRASASVLIAHPGAAQLLAPRLSARPLPPLAGARASCLLQQPLQAQERGWRGLLQQRGNTTSRDL
jgi:hypothetical protein